MIPSEDYSPKWPLEIHFERTKSNFEVGILVSYPVFISGADYWGFEIQCSMFCFGWSNGES